jgi:hypothetical protein
MVQIHKKFTDSQVKDLIERYLDKKIERKYIQKILARKRAGIEGIPSTLRRRYKIDHLPVRGEIRVKVWLGFKISAINCKRLIKGLMNRPIPELSTLLYNHLLSLFSFQRTYRVKFTA